MRVHYLPTLCSLLLTAVMAIPVCAQSGSRDSRDRDQMDRQSNHDSQNRSSQNRSDQRDNDRQSQNRDSQRDSQRKQNANNNRNNSSQNYRVEPVGWVQVAVDYDNDGYYDGVETLYYYDLQNARQNSEQRARSGQNQRSSQQANSRDRNQQNQRSNREQVRVRGEIVKLETKTMMGDSQASDQKKKFARIKTDSGRTVQVCLGSKEKLSQLDLSEGDRVTIEGVRTKVDDKEVVLAQRVSAGGESITNDLPRRQSWKRLAGKVRSLHETRGGERSKTHTVAKIAIDGGRTKSIDLGPKNELDGLDIEEGDTIAVLGRQGKIDGESMVIAQVVRANDETIDVREATKRSLRKNRSNQDRSDQNRGNQDRDDQNRNSQNRDRDDR